MGTCLRTFFLFSQIFTICFILQSSSASISPKHRQHFPSAMVESSVYCNTCFQRDFPKFSHFIPGALVEVKCVEGIGPNKLRFQRRVKKNGCNNEQRVSTTAKYWLLSRKGVRPALLFPPPIPFLPSPPNVGGIPLPPNPLQPPPSILPPLPFQPPPPPFIGIPPLPNIPSFPSIPPLPILVPPPPPPPPVFIPPLPFPPMFPPLPFPPIFPGDPPPAASAQRTIP